MKRPKKSDYYNDYDDYIIPSKSFDAYRYCDDLEKYCDWLEEEQKEPEIVDGEITYNTSSELILEVSSQFCPKCNPYTWMNHTVPPQPKQQCSECGYIHETLTIDIS